MNKNNPVITTLIRLGISLGITLVVSAILLLTVTFVAYKTEDPAVMVKSMSLTVLGVVSAVGGGIASRLCDRDALPPIAFSAICGAVYCLVLFLLTVLPVNSGIEGESVPRIIVYLAVIALFTLGGVIVRPREKKRLPYKKKTRR